MHVPFSGHSLSTVACRLQLSSLMDCVLYILYLICSVSLGSSGQFQGIFFFGGGGGVVAVPDAA